MTPREIVRLRLANQHITGQPLASPSAVVSSLGAVQAQDYPASLWAIGLRCKGATRSDVEAAIVERKIVRTWPMRHTLHFVPPELVRAMLSIYPEKDIPNYQKNNGLTDKILEKGLKLVANAFKEKEQLTYKEMHQALEHTGIPAMDKTDVQAHIIRKAGRKGIICFGSHQGKLPTFALLDEWVPRARPMGKEVILKEMAERYFTSHGPATLKDFVWWSGVKVSDARIGIGKASGLTELEIGGKAHYMRSRMPKPRDSSGVYLLPAFDEYLISYTDRSAMLGNEETQRILKSGKIVFTHSNGIFLPIIVIDGQVVGTWNRKQEKARLVVGLKPFVRLTKEQMSGIKERVADYGRFMECDAVLKP
ncbi:MAG TPA: winged helix DNA-binding domain-containing protein [Candidatus Acidoferrales bacterium]|nr:winged helix DNA-binding domain-containing protein [Candidatus Acidoferrales bacterium]